MGILSFPLFMGEGFVAFAVTMALSFVATAILTFLFGHTPEMDGDVAGAWDGARLTSSPARHQGHRRAMGLRHAQRATLPVC